ncbi:GNAT family N-acetyltransferase [Croceiramulus getboli]|nr:GNAT family N-acetyltransferase [Flavobacteriaceae bacterium YJPT1-3]
MGAPTLVGDTIFLRALEPEDIDMLYDIENREEYWELSGTQAPYGRHLLQEYIANAYKDLYEAKQLRFVICLRETQRVLGLVDLFDFSPRHFRAGVGILIIEAEDRRHGYALETLEILKAYAFKQLDLHQLYANILEENTASQRLFEKVGFVLVGIKKDWRRLQGSYKNELLYQLINIHVH